jgi:tRNA nucleotidyltransferase (CCA-adding enzyme)
MDGLSAALLGGLGVTARTALNLAEGLAAAKSLCGLPLLGSLPVTLQRNARSNSVSADRMASLLTKALELLLEPSPKTRAFASAKSKSR